ncbi:hypothetical protein [Paraburkholderia tropica]|uniref:hypothetical protein n=1 Tax=Paraburkholderia tropica TaxID=92647 RepID=UPI002AB642BC|nr:hypothetical protein [Paraburkholderia tropica]
MLSIGSYFDIYDENERHAYFFWPSLRQPLSLSLVSPRMFEPAHHYSFGTNRHFTEITRDEIEDITTAMQLARRAFLSGGGMMHARSTAGESELRAVLGKVGMCGSGSTGGQPLQNSRLLWDAVRRAVREGALIFVPEREDLHACVKAVQEDREKRSSHGAQRTQDNNPYATVQQMMGKPPRVPSGLKTPLGDAQPFEYQAAGLSDVTEELAASTNNPRYAAKMLGYDQNTFSEMLHVFKPANGLGPADNVIFHDDGSVEFNLRILDDNIHNYAP